MKRTHTYTDSLVPKILDRQKNAGSIVPEKVDISLMDICMALNLNKISLKHTRSPITQIQTQASTHIHTRRNIKQRKIGES